MYFVYVLQSLKKEIFYIGSTSNVEKRLRKHNGGSTKSTKPYIPWVVICTEEYKGKQEACKREYFLKHPKGFWEKKKIISQNKRSV